MLDMDPHTEMKSKKTASVFASLECNWELNFLRDCVYKTV